MKPITFVFLLAIFGCAHSPNQSNDLFIFNAKIYTVNDAQPTAEAVVVKNGKIVFVGDSSKAQSHLSEGVKKIDFKGKALYPGFVDAHAHLAGIGFREMSLDLSSVKSIKELIVKVKEKKQNTNGWVQGGGWIETHWPEKRFPNRYDLDRVSTTRPIFLRRADGHATVVNSKALEIAGVTNKTLTPKGGEILKDKKGEPTGLFLDRAISLVGKHVPDPTKEQMAKALVKGAKRSAKKGWAGLHDTNGSWEEYETIYSLVKSGEIPIRIYKSINAPSESANRLFKKGPLKSFDGKLVLRSLKVFADGALGSRGAALLAPYSDHPHSKGLLLVDDKKFLDLQEKAKASNIQIRTHAIGDLANRKILDLFEKGTKAMSKEDRIKLRWRVEHAQILHPKDIDRFSKLGLIASMQPSHAIGDLHFAKDRVGTKRLKGAYAWKSLLDRGVIIAGGSDAPVENGDPLIEFYAAVARNDLKGFSASHWNSKEKVTREQALKMFTLWAAYSAFEEKERGSIEVGKYADFTAFNGDLMKIPVGEIPKLKTVLTVVNGKIVYSNF